MEVLELFCELLLARFGLFEQKHCDPTLLEAVQTLIYSASRSDIKELITVRDLLIRKFGRDFGDIALNNRSGLVNPRVLNRLNLTIPEASMVTSYLVEIAAKYKVAFTPPSPVQVPEKEALIVPPAQDELPAHFKIPPYLQSSAAPAASVSQGYQSSPSQTPQFVHPPVAPSVKSPGSSGYEDNVSLAIPKLPDDDDDDDEVQDAKDENDFAQGANDETCLPQVPQDLPQTSESEQDVESGFDELTKRFEALKKRK